MKILMDENDTPLFLEIAAHMNIKLDNPAFLFEVDNPGLTACAVALGGIQFVELPKPLESATLAVVEPDDEPESETTDQSMGRDLDMVTIVESPETQEVEVADPTSTPASETSVPGVIKRNGKSSGFTVAQPAKICEICGKAFHGHPLADVCSSVCRKEKNRRYAAEYQAKKRNSGAEAGAEAAAPLA